jgi:hypothetical protein
MLKFAIKALTKFLSYTKARGIKAFKLFLFSTSPTLSPIDDATEVNTSTNLVITFEKQLMLRLKI